MDVRTSLASTLLWQGAVPPGGRGPSIRTSITAVEVRALRRLAREAVVVEIGSAYGYSTVAMALVAKRVISVDPHTGLQGSLEELRHNLAEFGVADRVDVVVATSQAFCSRKPARAVDLVFIDGDHSYEATLRDLQCAGRILRPGGAVAVHDYTRLESVRRAVEAARGDATPEVVDSVAIIKGFRFAEQVKHPRVQHGWWARLLGVPEAEDLSP